MQTASLQTLGHWNQALAATLQAVRSDDFPDRLMDAIGTVVPIESALIGLEQRGAAPTLLFERGTPPGVHAQVIRRYYTRGYLLDPFCLAVEQGLAEGFYALGDIAPDDFFASEYYKTYYLAAGLVEDCSFIIDIGQARKVSISLYNGLSCTRFRQSQLRALRALAPMVIALGRRHWEEAAVEIVAASAVVAERSRESLEGFGSGLLTERERAICQLLLRGHSAKSSARELGISPETVRMHRKNLYAKLHVGSQAELFAMFIEWLGGR